MWLKITFLLTRAMRTMIYTGICFLIRILLKIIFRVVEKVKYAMQSGISPYMKELVQSDLQGQPFPFHFDEITSSQVKKQSNTMPLTTAQNTKKYLQHIVDLCTLENALLIICWSTFTSL